MVSAETMHQDYQQRMLDRIQHVDEQAQTHLPDTDSLFAATRQLRATLEAQLKDAEDWGTMLDHGSEDEELLAYQLQDYSFALEVALDNTRPAPHYQAVRSSLEQKLDPEQEAAVYEAGTMSEVMSASMEHALASGYDTLQGGQGSDSPAQYRHAKEAWDADCSAGTIDGEHVGYVLMAPVKEQVREVLTPAQRIEADQRQIDAMMIGHTPMATRLGVDPLEMHASEMYGTPMTALEADSPTRAHAQASPAQLHQTVAAPMTTHHFRTSGPTIG